MWIFFFFFFLKKQIKESLIDFKPNVPKLQSRTFSSFLSTINLNKTLKLFHFI